MNLSIQLLKVIKILLSKTMITNMNITCPESYNAPTHYGDEAL